jgi:DNA repair exonuclease SbcCD nuclease subunit
VSDLAGAGLDYWALGHVHTRQTLREREPVIVYPGNSQGRHPNEPGERGVYLVEVDDGGTVRLEFRPVDVVRWETLSLDIGALETEQDLIDAATSVAEESLDAAGGRHVVARLTLTGRGSLHRWLRSGDTAAAIREQINDHWADRATWLWCEGVQLDTAAPVDRELVAQREDFLGDLTRLAGEMRESDEALAEFRQLLQPLYSRREVREFLRDFVPSDDEMRELLAAAEEECLSELAPEEE